MLEISIAACKADTLFGYLTLVGKTWSPRRLSSLSVLIPHYQTISSYKIDEACSPERKKADFALNLDICDLVKSKISQ